jgi:IMP dehydrogenase/GMP reductase
MRRKVKEYSRTEHISFDDILLIPQNSEIQSRKDVSLSTILSDGLELALPIIAAPMDTVCEENMALAIGLAGGLGIIHRYMPIDEQALKVKKVKEAGVIVGGSVGARGSFVGDAEILVKSGADLILIDIANGHNQHAINAVATLKDIFKDDVHIMAGNVATWEGFARLADAGADSIRVGIGGGSACTTRVVSGHGVPTLASILDIRSRVSYEDSPALIADGGIRNSGDAAKALAAGAHAVMLGRLLAGTTESPGQVENNHKVFRGMASREAQEAGRGAVSGVEGISTRVPFVGSVSNIINDLTAGLQSALSYSGVERLVDFYYESVYNRVTSNTLNETKPHAKE